MAQTSRSLTLQNFGRTMRLFAPLYLSNECINNCRYCGFSRDNPILRVTLDVDEVVAEAQHLLARDFARSFSSRASIRNLSAAIISRNACARSRRIFRRFRSKSVRWKRRITCRLSRLARKGSSFIRKHTIAASMPKCIPPGRSAISIFGSIAPSAVMPPDFAGSASARCLVCRAGRTKPSLSQRMWNICSNIAGRRKSRVSLPRLRPAAGGFRPLFSMTDRELAQLVCALRITFPQVGIVLSTRERASLRDSLALIGVTMMSAGSHTEPGGYTRQGREHLHRTVRGRIVAPEYQDGEDQLATGQFEISDERSPAEIAAVLRRRGFEPVWKDWDQALCGSMRINFERPESNEPIDELARLASTCR